MAFTFCGCGVVTDAATVGWMATGSDEHWGRWVKARAKHLGLQLKEVAAAVGVAPHTLSRWLASHEFPNMKRANRDRLAAVLDVKPGFLEFAELAMAPESEGPSPEAAEAMERYHAGKVGSWEELNLLRLRYKTEAIGTIAYYCSILPTEEVLEVQADVLERTKLAATQGQLRPHGEAKK